LPTGQHPDFRKSTFCSQLLPKDLPARRHMRLLRVSANKSFDEEQARHSR
jgi:hypothetical protein